jgi:hypothetical protein
MQEPAPVPTKTSHRRSLAVATLILSVALVGCGGDDSDADGAPTGAAPEASHDPAVPEECTEAFPGTFGEPDIDDVSLMPADWPEPIDDAVLCTTSSTADDSQESASYATSSDEEDVLAAFESALGGLDGYEVSRKDPSGLGRTMLSGSAGGVFFELEAVPGGFSVVFAGP